MCPSLSTPAIENRRAARKAGLRYVSDADPGIHRKPHGQGFEYKDQGGRQLRNACAQADSRACHPSSLAGCLDLTVR
jgi:DNA topoisomerase IB